MLDGCPSRKHFRDTFCSRIHEYFCLVHCSINCIRKELYWETQIYTNTNTYKISLSVICVVVNGYGTIFAWSSFISVQCPEKGKIIELLVPRIKSFICVLHVVHIHDVKKLMIQAACSICQFDQNISLHVRWLDNTKQAAWNGKRCMISLMKKAETLGGN